VGIKKPIWEGGGAGNQLSFKDGVEYGYIEKYNLATFEQ